MHIPFLNLNSIFFLYQEKLSSPASQLPPNFAENITANITHAMKTEIESHVLPRNIIIIYVYDYYLFFMYLYGG